MNVLLIKSAVEKENPQTNSRLRTPQGLWRRLNRFKLLFYRVWRAQWVTSTPAQYHYLLCVAWLNTTLSKKMFHDKFIQPVTDAHLQQIIQFFRWFQDQPDTKTFVMLVIWTNVLIKSHTNKMTEFGLLKILAQL